jgi:cell wall-associated NlpC family hydrolase
MYIGNGQMVHAPTSGDVVKISPLQSQYSGARRPG